MHQMTTRRPYLIRAFHEWILDNGLTPYISVDAEYEGVEVPHQFVIEGEIVLNVSPAAVRNLELGQDYILFDARFGGKPMSIVVPNKAVYAIYAQENGEGMAFGFKRRPEETWETLEDSGVHPTVNKKGVSRDDNDPEPPKPPPGRPSLKVVK